MLPAPCPRGPCGRPAESLEAARGLLDAVRALPARPLWPSCRFPGSYPWPPGCCPRPARAAPVAARQSPWKLPVASWMLPALCPRGPCGHPAESLEAARGLLDAARALLARPVRPSGRVPGSCPCTPGCCPRPARAAPVAVQYSPWKLSVASWMLPAPCPRGPRGRPAESLEAARGSWMLPALCPRGPCGPPAESLEAARGLLDAARALPARPLWPSSRVPGSFPWPPGCCPRPARAAPVAVLQGPWKLSVASWMLPCPRGFRGRPAESLVPVASWTLPALCPRGPCGRRAASLAAARGLLDAARALPARSLWPSCRVPGSCPWIPGCCPRPARAAAVAVQQGPWKLPAVASWMLPTPCPRGPCGRPAESLEATRGLLDAARALPARPP